MGTLVGAWLWGIVADRIGRKKTYFICSGLMIASGLGTTFSFSYYIFVFFRFCTAFSSAGVILGMYVLGVEIVGISARSVTGIAGNGVFGASFALLALLAYLIREWRLLLGLISLSGLVIFSIIRCTPMFSI